MIAKVTLIDEENFTPPLELGTYKVEPIRKLEDDMREQFYFSFEFARLKIVRDLDIKIRDLENI